MNATGNDNDNKRNGTMTFVTDMINLVTSTNPIALPFQIAIIGYGVVVVLNLARALLMPSR